MRRKPKTSDTGKNDVVWPLTSVTIHINYATAWLRQHGLRGKSMALKNLDIARKHARDLVEIRRLG